MPLLISDPATQRVNTASRLPQPLALLPSCSKVTLHGGDVGAKAEDKADKISLYSQCI